MYQLFVDVVIFSNYVNRFFVYIYINIYSYIHSNLNVTLIYLIETRNVSDFHSLSLK